MVERKEDRKSKFLDIFIIDVTDEYQTYNFWNMKKSELKNIVREEIFKILDENDGSREISDKLAKLMNVNLSRDYSKNVMKPKEKPEGESKEYEVEYWFRFGKYGDDKDNDVIKVKASSEEEAIKKAKEEAPRNSITSSFKVKK